MLNILFYFMSERAIFLVFVLTFFLKLRFKFILGVIYTVQASLILGKTIL